MTKKNEIPRPLQKRVHVFCKKCEHVAKRYHDLIKLPCIKCGSLQVIVRPRGCGARRWS